MAWCDPSALPDSLMIMGAGSMPRSMHTSCQAPARVHAELQRIV